MILPRSSQLFGRSTASDNIAIACFNVLIYLAYPKTYFDKEDDEKLIFLIYSTPYLNI